MALQAPLRRPGRSLLTALGLAIGVGTFIAMVSFGRGARSSVVSQFETLGSNLLRLKTYYGVTEDVPKPLTEADVEALRSETTTLEVVVPFAFANYDVTAGQLTHRTSVGGTTPDFVRTRQWEFSAGGRFERADMQTRAKVCILGQSAADSLFAGRSALGQRITIDGRLSCRVIGVVGRGSTVRGGDPDDRILMPLPTYETYLGGQGGYDVIEIRPLSRELLAAASAEVARVIRQTHRIARGDVDDFAIISPDKLTDVASQVGGILTALLAAIASVSLLVGGIGIMNIQLVSVAERTHEIGVRASVGASPGSILAQFLAEAAVMSSLGALAGVAVGIGLSVAVARQMGWPEATSVDVVIGAALFGIAVGTLFGYLPARRAARLDPIDALRR